MDADCNLILGDDTAINVKNSDVNRMNARYLSDNRSKCVRMLRDSL